MDTNDATTVAADSAAMPETQVQTQGDTQTVDTSTQVAEKAPPSAREAIAKAFEKMKAPDQGADKPIAGDQQTQGRDRNADGTFRAGTAGQEKPASTQTQVKPGAEVEKPATGFGDAPQRFSPDAKAAWATAPEAIKGEVTRAIKELETGIQQYQTAFQPYRDFDKQIRDNGQTFEQVFAHYSGIENLLREKPIAGLDRICRNFGSSIEEVARHVLNQPAEQGQQRDNAYITQLEQKITALEQKVGGVTTTIKTQQEKAIMDNIDAFAADPAHEHFDAIAEDIAFFMNNGRTNDLQEAYDLALRLNPTLVTAPAPVIAAPAAIQTDTSHTRKGQLSPSGAPAIGSDPVTSTPPASAKDAVQRSFAALGL